jgi:hypothetical protein
MIPGLRCNIKLQYDEFIVCPACAAVGPERAYRRQAAATARKALLLVAWVLSPLAAGLSMRLVLAQAFAGPLVRMLEPALVAFALATIVFLRLTRAAGGADAAPADAAPAALRDAGGGGGRPGLRARETLGGEEQAEDSRAATPVPDFAPGGCSAAGPAPGSRSPSPLALLASMAGARAATDATVEARLAALEQVVASGFGTVETRLACVERDFARLMEHVQASVCVVSQLRRNTDTSATSVHARLERLEQGLSGALHRPAPLAWTRMCGIYYNASRGSFRLRNY